MILGNPLLDDRNEFLGLGHNLLRLSLGGDKGVIVVNHVPLPPASIEVITVRVSSFPNRELNHVERNPVVSGAYNAVTSTSNRHFCGLQGGIVGGCETPVC